MTTTLTHADVPTSAGHTPEEGRRYRFERLSLPLILADMRYKREDPKAGDRVPDFDLPTTTGGRFASDHLGDRPVLLVFGSLTCPITEASGPGINDLHARYGDRVRFVAVNVREAHPGENIDQPQNMREKVAHAHALQAHHSFVFEVAVDDIDGTLHRALGPKPNSAYLLDPSGIIGVRAQWATDTNALDAALGAIVAELPPPRATVRRTIPNVVGSIGYIDAVLDRAGARAKRDMWKAAPPMAALARTATLFTRLRVTRRGPVAVAALLATTLLGAVVIAAATAAQ